MTAIDPLITWLRRQPQPFAVVADDQRVTVPTTPRRWSELVTTLRAMGATKVVALDRAGATLRATTVDEDEDEDQVKDGRPAPSALGSDLTMMSKLLADAYRTGAETSMRAMSGAIEENTKLVKLLADRLGAIEMAWQRNLSTNARLVTDLAEARAQATGGDGDDAALAPLLAMIANGAASAAAPSVRKVK